MPEIVLKETKEKNDQPFLLYGASAESFVDTEVSESGPKCHWNEATPDCCCPHDDYSYLRRMFKGMLNIFA